MSNDKNEPGKASPRPGEPAQPKRPTPTIDLEAKVIETRDMPGAERKAADAAKPSAAPAAGAKPNPGEGKPPPGPVPPAGGKSTAGAPPSAAPADGAKRRGGGFLSHVAAGLVGALLALFGGDLASRQLGLDLPLLGAHSGAADQELRDRLGALERSVKEQESDAVAAELRERIDALAGQLNALRTSAEKVGALEAAQTKLAAQVGDLKAGLAQAPAAGAQVSAALEQRLAAMEATLKTIGEAAKDGGGGRVAQLADLTGRVNDFALQLDSRLEALRRSVAQDLERQGTALTQRIAESTSSGEATELAIATLKEGATRLGKDVETLKLEAGKLAERLDAGLAQGEEVRRAAEAARDRADEIASGLADLKSGLDGRIGTLVKSDEVAALLAPLTAGLESVKGDVERVLGGERSREAATNRILLSLELANLKRAIDRGGSYAGELAAVKRLATDDLPLAALEPSAAEGLPTARSLEESFRPAARAILDASTASSGDGSFIDTLISGARSVVRVRKTGDVPGSDAEAIVARMETRLRNGDLEGVAHEAEGLSGAARTAAQPFLDQIAGRIAVDRAIGEIEAGLKKMMAGGSAN